MTSQSDDTQVLTQQGLAALRAGDAQTARDRFEQAVVINQTDVSTWLGLAFACGNLGDSKAKLAAVDKALALEPRNLRALLFKADHYDQTGESRKALAFYQGALNVAQQTEQLPQDVQAGLQRAKTVSDRLTAEYEAYLLDRLSSQGFRRGTSSSRFEQSVDIAFGKTQVYYQEPTRYYFPGLPQIQFYERASFPWLDTIEAATDDIRAELQNLMQDGDSFKPYLQTDTSAPEFNDSGNVDNPDWGACYLWQQGELIPDNAARCPKTVKALESAPFPDVPGQSPNALFSKLNPNTRIPPHVGMLNTRLICHLPIMVPENCGALRVGNQVRSWVEGEALVFDDSIQHEAWNESNQTRVVLLFDIWRPELSEEERRLVSTMMEAVHMYGKE